MRLRETLTMNKKDMYLDFNQNKRRGRKKNSGEISFYQERKGGYGWKILVVFLPVSLEHFVNQQCITKIGKLTLVRKGWIFRNLVLKQTQKERETNTHIQETNQ